METEETLTWQELQAKGKIIEHTTPNNELYSDSDEKGRCPNCLAWFTCSYDLEQHKKICKTPRPENWRIRYGEYLERNRPNKLVTLG
jgi:hypothetical protein